MGEETGLTPNTAYIKVDFHHQGTAERRRTMKSSNWQGIKEITTI
jgi:hypothetical protein